MNDAPPISISIVAACRNEAAHIADFLDSLLAQDMNGMEWEAIVADGMSDDGTPEILRSYTLTHPRLQVIRNPERIVSTGLNAAIRAARGEIILRMDAHTRYAPDYCRRCVEGLLRTGADNAGGPARTCARGVRARAIAAAYHSRFSTGGARFHDESFEGWVDTVPYGCWRKTTLMRLGLFDESLIRNQDDELNLRLVRGGGRIWQSPAIRSWYAPRAGLRALFRQYFQYGFWKVAVIRKHRIPASLRHLVPAAFVIANAVLLAGAAIAAAGGSVEWLRAFAGLWVAMSCAYGVLIVVAAVAVAAQKGIEMLPYLPPVFAVYHVSYGLGFCAGLLRFSSRRAPAVQAESVFARLTR